MGCVFRPLKLVQRAERQDLLDAGAAQAHLGREEGQLRHLQDAQWNEIRESEPLFGEDRLTS